MGVNVSDTIHNGKYIASAMNFTAQAADAVEQQRKMRAWFITEDYQEVAPGVLKSPDGKVTVEL